MDDGVYAFGCIDLVGVLDALCLLPTFDLSYLNDRIENIPIKTRLESQDNENLQKNLFRLFCAITNVPFNQRESRYLDDRTLLSCLQTVDDNLDEKSLLAAQIQAIKTLISRPQFSLTDKQIRQIRHKFINLFDYRTGAQSGVDQWDKPRPAPEQEPALQYAQPADSRQRLKLTKPSLS